MRYLFLLSFVVACFSLSAKDREVITLGSGTNEAYVVRKHVEYFVDTSCNKTPLEVLNLQKYERIKDEVPDLLNENRAYAYWIKFSIVNQDPDNHFRLEMYDFDIDEVTLYSFKNNELEESHSGYSENFNSRDLYHKNIGFLLPLPANDTITFLMRFKSHKINILEPVIRSVPAFYKYSVIEYTMLGFFYGFTCVIIIYNLLYFIVLRRVQYLYYLLYMSGITIYLMSRNGTGFQFFWPENPSINFWLGPFSGTIGVGALLLFTITFLNLKNFNRKAYYFLIALTVINICSIPFQIIYEADLFHQVTMILLVQAAFCVGIPCYRRQYSNVWFLVGFVILDMGFVIFWLEHVNIIPSSIFTVYILYFTINLQFITISISLAQSIRQLADEKNKALMELLKTADKNEVMRILALKKQMSPHFIFNALNSILQRIMSGNKDEASEHLVRFSKLIRKTMEQSDMLYSKLSDELELLRLYLSLEAMRLGKTFSYSIEIAPDVDVDQAEIPSFLLQPFVENSIWHGLMPKSGSKKVWLKIDKKDNVLLICIEDNGIGREQSVNNKKTHGSKSQGINLITERLQLLNNKYQSRSAIEIIDLYDSNKAAKGTRVIITISFINEQLHKNHYH